MTTHNVNTITAFILYSPSYSTVLVEWLCYCFTPFTGELQAFSIQSSRNRNTSVWSAIVSPSLMIWITNSNILTASQTVQYIGTFKILIFMQWNYAIFKIYSRFKLTNKFPFPYLRFETYRAKDEHVQRKQRRKKAALPPSQLHPMCIWSTSFRSGTKIWIAFGIMCPKPSNCQFIILSIQHKS